MDGAAADRRLRIYIYIYIYIDRSPRWLRTFFPTQRRRCIDLLPERVPPASALAGAILQLYEQSSDPPCAGPFAWRANPIVHD